MGLKMGYARGVSDETKNGMDCSLTRTAYVVRRGVDQGLHTGAQVSVWHKRIGAVDGAWGEARPGVAMATDTTMLWLSSGKPLLAVAVAQLVEKGLLEFDDAVSDFVPAFGEKDKEEITIEQVLAHTGGFRSVAFKYPEMSWDEAIEAVCAARLETGWKLGETAGYHPHSGWNILGRVVEVCTCESLGAYLQQALLVPLGMHDTWVGLPKETYTRLMPNRLSTVDNTALTPTKPTGMDDEAWTTGVRPGGNTWGPARELACFYRAMLAGGALEGGRVLAQDMVDRLTSRHRVNTMDRTFRATMDWGLGFMVNNRRHDAVNTATHGPTGTPYNFGPYAGDDAFGHGGNQSSVGFADPTHGLAVAVVFNGLCGEPKHQQRMMDVLEALYQDLNLA